MPVYETMSDGYKAHLFETWKGAFIHLMQCGCWICEYREQERKAMLYRDEQEEIPFWVHEAYDGIYWGEVNEDE